ARQMDTNELNARCQNGWELVTIDPRPPFVYYLLRKRNTIDDALPTLIEQTEILTVKVLEALIGLAALHREADPHHPPVLPIKAIVTAANLLADQEDLITPRKVGSIVRKQLHLRTERSGKHNGSFVAIWDETRIDALRRRFGIDEEMETGIMDVLRSRFLAEAGG
ncbi:MAG TPA: hypothetical protein VM366_14445, partial [Anaerolineae bacterium]|nr:hypothetical protein [Anaerolineae bacterium]